ncbi:MAG: hypothetical protein WCP33_08300, partial [Deltaproteobacteria bacterium]
MDLAKIRQKAKKSTYVTASAESSHTETMISPSPLEAVNGILPESLEIDDSFGATAVVPVSPDTVPCLPHSVLPHYT